MAPCQPPTTATPEWFLGDLPRPSATSPPCSETCEAAAELAPSGLAWMAPKALEKRALSRALLLPLGQGRHRGGATPARVGADLLWSGPAGGRGHAGSLSFCKLETNLGEPTSPIQTLLRFQKQSAVSGKESYKSVNQKHYRKGRRSAHRSRSGRRQEPGRGTGQAAVTDTAYSQDGAFARLLTRELPLSLTFPESVRN